MNQEECEISAKALCKLAGLDYISSKIEDDGSVTIRFIGYTPPRPKPKPDDDEDLGF